jgi:hypothetical protein
MPILILIPIFIRIPIAFTNRRAFLAYSRTGDFAPINRGVAHGLIISCPFRAFWPHPLHKLRLKALYIISPWAKPRVYVMMR